MDTKARGGSILLASKCNQRISFISSAHLKLTRMSAADAAVSEKFDLESWTWVKISIRSVGSKKEGRFDYL